MNKTLKYSLFLLVLGLVAGGLLALVNSITSPIITERKEKEANETMKSFFPDYEFTTVTDQFSDLDDAVQAVYFGSTSDAKLIVFKVAKVGYKGDVVTLVAIDIATGDFKLVKTIEASAETVGFGQEALKLDFTSLYSNVDAYKLTTVRGGMKEIMAGATITYSAIIESVDAAIKTFGSELNIINGLKVG